MTFLFCALFVFYFYYDVVVLRTICFLLLLLRWCIAHYLFSTLTITLVLCALFVFYFYNYVGFFAQYLLSTLTITLVFCALFVIYFHFYAGVLRTICFLLSLIRGYLHTIYFLHLLLRWCFAHFLSSFTITLVCCAPFVFYFC